MTNDIDAEAILGRLHFLSVTVFGDYCLDAYWTLDESEDELSLETGLPLRRVREQRYSLGGAGNVVANLLDLGVGCVRTVGLAGQDLFGNQLRHLLHEGGADLDGYIQLPDWQTMVYVKPRQHGAELNRLDFGAFNKTAPADAERLLEKLQRAAMHSDVVVFNQQVPGSLSSPAFIERLNEVIAAHPQALFVVDARHYANHYRAAVMKLNFEEAARFLNKPWTGKEDVDVARVYASDIFQETRRPVFITQGKHGIIAADNDGVVLVPGTTVTGPVDPVGAGDTVISTIAATLGSGFSSIVAAQMATIAAGITVQKLNTTGTATPDDIRAAMGRMTVTKEGVAA